MDRQWYGFGFHSLIISQNSLQQCVEKLSISSKFKLKELYLEKMLIDNDSFASLAKAIDSMKCLDTISLGNVIEDSL